MEGLMTRKDFREGVFARDRNNCVVPNCTNKVADAHHIIERRLWSDGGYYIDNGASLCTKHHKLAETNHIPPCVVRLYAGIKNTIIPTTLDPTKHYDKWGKELKLSNRHDIKYPSTYYFNFSPSQYDESGRAECVNTKDFLNVPLVATIKMDGSNAKLTRDYVASRNGSQANHKSFDMLKAVHPTFKDKIPENVMVFGEWLYALHSIHYKDNLSLNAFFQVFGVYNMDECIWGGWEQVKTMADRLGFSTVPVIEVFEVEHEWQFVEKVSKMAEELVAQGHEGLVVRNYYPFHYGQFEHFMGKYVRANHVQTDIHWTKNDITRNEISK